MRRIIFSLAIAIGCAAMLPGQQNPSQQTARQALVEMFFSKTPGTFVEHLPAVTRTALVRAGTMANLEQLSLLTSQVHAQNQSDFQTFETGPVLLSVNDPKTNQKFEVTVQDDAMHGEVDDILLSFKVYKNGEPQATPYMPQLTFSMKKEAQLWTLNEISLTVHLPLTDPNLLKAFTEGMMKARTQTGATTTLVSHNETPAQPTGSDTAVIGALRSIVTAETTYAVTYPSVGFTCTLSDLDGFGGGEPNEHQAMLLNSGLAGGHRYGFVFALSGCTASPSPKFRLTAAPNASAFGRKAFCTDQSGVIRSSNDGDPETCLTRGTPIQ
jgi:hypothetical protein